MPHLDGLVVRGPIFPPQLSHGSCGLLPSTTNRCHQLMLAYRLFLGKTRVARRVYKEGSSVEDLERYPGSSGSSVHNVFHRLQGFTTEGAPRPLRSAPDRSLGASTSVNSP